MDLIGPTMSLMSFWGSRGVFLGSIWCLVAKRLKFCFSQTTWIQQSPEIFPALIGRNWEPRTRHADAVFPPVVRNRILYVGSLIPLA